MFSEEPKPLIILAAAAVAGYMAMNIGANDVTNNVGAAVGSRAITMTTALIIAAIFEIAGAVFAGGRVVSTIEAGIVDAAQMPSGEAFVWVMMAALVSAAVWINIATWVGARFPPPIRLSAAFWERASLRPVFPPCIGFRWPGSPQAGWFRRSLAAASAALLLAFIKTFIIYREDKIEAAVFWTPILIAVMAGAFATYFALIGIEKVAHLSMTTGLLTGLVAAGVTALISRPWIIRQARGLENRNQSLRKLFQMPLILSAALLSFAHGANDVSNAVGPLAAIVANVNGLAIVQTTYVPLWVMLIGAFGISCGLLLFGPKLIRVVGEEITKLNPMRAYCVALATAITVILATSFGLPVSTTHTAVGAVFGIGFFREWYTRNSKRRLEYVRQKTGQLDFERRVKHSPEEWHRRRLVRRSHFLTIVSAWVITVPVSALLSAAVYCVFAALFI